MFAKISMMKKFVLKEKNKKYKLGHTTQNFLYKKQKITQLSLDMSQTIPVYNQTDNDDEQKQKEQLDYAEQSVSKQKTKKKKVWNAIFFAFNIVVVVVILSYQITKETITPISDIKNFRGYFIPVIIAAFALVMLIDTHRTNIFLKQSGSRSRPYLCYKMCAIGKYYDNITPMSSGGEPSQIFYMNHRGLDASTAISVPMARYVVSQIAWMIVGIFAVLTIIFEGTMDVSVVLVVGLVGFGANFLLTSLCLLLSMNKKLGNKLVVKVLKFLKKIKIIKHYDKQYERVNNVVGNYQSTMQTYAKNKFVFIYAILISVLIFIINYTMPYLIYLLLGGTKYSVWFDMVIYSVIIELASSIIPLPGGTGMNEISFTVIFGSIFPGGTVFWGLLIWRFMTFYMYILQGISIIIYDYVHGNKKFKWLQKKWELEAESAIFKEEQIKNYKSKRKKQNSKNKTTN